MEIDKAIRECTDRRLQTKYRNAIYVIERAFALYSFEDVAFSFNGGKDSTVLLHLLRAGYYSHSKNCCNRNVTDSVQKCPIRTIYFESPSAFTEINSFTYKMATIYDLQLEIIRLDFMSGLEDLMSKKPIKAIFLGTRIGDPNAVGQEQFSPSSPGWPPFMRVNPILDWSYRDIWAFILTSKVQYCSLYNQGYTSIGSIHDTVPNELLSVVDSSGNIDHFNPAYLLSDGRLERAGRAKKPHFVRDVAGSLGNDMSGVCLHPSSSLVASIIGVGDEILNGTFEGNLTTSLCKKLHTIGWQVTHKTVVRNDVDSVAEEVEQRKSSSDLVLLFGGVGPLHSDVSVAGVAKAFGVRLAPDEEFEEYLRHLYGNQCTGDRNEMALLPESITELLHHQDLPVPLLIAIDRKKRRDLLATSGSSILRILEFSRRVFHSIQIMCQNVIILSATNTNELEMQWKCLLDLPRTPLMQLIPFKLKHLSTFLSDIEITNTLSKLFLEFPDIYIGCHRKSRQGPLIIDFVGKDLGRIEVASQYLYKKFPDGTFSEIKCG